MLQFAIIKPKDRTITVVKFETIQEAERAAGLDPGAVDHGVLTPGIGYVFDEFGLRKPPSEQHYFAVEGRLIAGPAVLYGIDKAGVTTDLTYMRPTRWFDDAAEIEAAIAAGTVRRPQMAVNGLIIWEWPQSCFTLDAATSALVADMTALNRESYIGDGLYVSHDGFQVKLRAPRGLDGDHEVYLDPSVLIEFVRWLYANDINIPQRGPKP